MKIEDLIIKEKDFAEAMEGKVLPFLKGKIKEGYFTTFDGLKLHYEMMVNPEEKAAIVMSHGYCEFTTKYAETMYYFYQMGYSVFIVEHRGHGFSDRQVEGFSKVHLNHFEDYVKDFHLFIEKVAKPESITGNLLLFAHSMGGGIGARYIEEHPDTFRCALLSSPMIKLSTGNTNPIILKITLALCYLPFLKNKYLPGYHDYDHSFKYPKCSAISKARYTYQYNEREREEHYQTNGCTFGWSRECFNVSKKILKNASSIKIPVIIMQASMDDLVVPEAQNAFTDLVPSSKLIRFEGSRHEIFNATDEIILDYYQKVFEFFESNR